MVLPTSLHCGQNGHIFRPCWPSVAGEKEARSIPGWLEFLPEGLVSSKVLLNTCTAMDLMALTWIGNIPEQLTVVVDLRTKILSETLFLNCVMLLLLRERTGKFPWLFQ